MRSINKLFVFLSLSFAACNNADDSSSTDATQGDSTAIATTPVTKESLAGCYSQVYERDTSSLQVKLINDSLAGDLVYRIFEKDRNDGMFKGDLNNDILSGWYYFKSEGVMSVRQVVWKVSNGQLWPGMGEMKIRNDTMVFSEPASLKFDNTHPFVKANCAE